MQRWSSNHHQGNLLHDSKRPRVFRVVEVTTVNTEPCTSTLGVLAACHGSSLHLNVMLVPTLLRCPAG